MIKWTRHSRNYEMQRPEGFPIAVWISPTAGAVFHYQVCIYGGGKLIVQKRYPDFESAESFVYTWLEKVSENLLELLRIPR